MGIAVPRRLILVTNIWRWLDMLTVGELRKQLDGVPPGVPVVVLYALHEKGYEIADVRFELPEGADFEGQGDHGALLAAEVMEVCLLLAGLPSAC